MLPNAAFSWHYRYPELFERLESSYRRVHRDEHLEIYALAGDTGTSAILDQAPALRVP